MKKGELKYILILTGLLIAFLLYQFLGKKPFDWTVTLYSGDKDPFGTYVLNESMEDLFRKVDKSNRTIYELQDSLRQNLMVVAVNFIPGEEDLESLLHFVNEGGNAFISAEMFSMSLTDTLQIETSDYQIDAPLFGEQSSDADSVELYMSGRFSDDKKYTFPVDHMYSQFDLFESEHIEVLAENDAGKPVLIHVPFGEGNLYLNSTPLIFSNHFMLQENNHRLAGTMLSFLTEEEVHWTEYYQVGKLQSGSPLRYILSSRPLSWAYYLTIAGLILFMIFEARRRQRIIPVITPLRNTTLDFVRTVSNLYYQHKDHKSIAEKRINFFLEQVRTSFFLPENLQGRQLYEQVAAKSGHSVAEVEYMYRFMQGLRDKNKISEEELRELNTLIENFRM